MDNIIIEKVINNNIISAYEKSGAEVIVMGRGIGFKKKQGEVVPADQISKIFRIKSRTLTEQFKELLANMPLERVRISDEIISHAKDHLKLKLNQSIYVTLTDHINFAIKESGLGRYDVMMEPLTENLDGIIMEFKVRNPAKEKDLEASVQNALCQIREKRYDTELEARGIPPERIRHYGFAFEGKKVLIGSDS